MKPQNIYTIYALFKNNMFKLDLKNRKILYELDVNGRQPFSELAKKVGLSEQVVAYRVQNMIKNGIIKGFITLFDVAKFGYSTYRVYIQYYGVSPQKEEEILQYFYNHPSIFWFASLSGRWDLEILVFAKNNEHLNKIIKGIMKTYGQYIRNNVLSIATDHFHFGRRYLVDKEYKISSEKPLAYYGGEPKMVKFDENDLRILKSLSNNARIPIIDIAKELHLTANAIKYRIKRLTKEGVIQAYRAWIDTSKIGFELHKALITLQNLTEEREKQMLTFFKITPNILYSIKCMGRWDIEIEAEVHNDEEFRQILMGFRHQFRDIIRDYETLLIYKEHKINYFPFEQ